MWRETHRRKIGFLRFSHEGDLKIQLFFASHNLILIYQKELKEITLLKKYLIKLEKK